MCGRYYIDDDTVRAIEQLVRRLDQSFSLHIQTGDIFPGQQAPILLAGASGLTAGLLPWGFPGFQKSRLIFNARSESVLEKPMFRDSIKSRRCVIPARSFYEWNRQREKYTFSRPDHGPLYLAGLYRRFEEEDHFVILTTAANNSMQEIHPRMPLILENGQLRDWIFDTGKAEALLRQAPPELDATAEYHQQTLKF